MANRSMESANLSGMQTSWSVTCTLLKTNRWYEAQQHCNFPCIKGGPHIGSEYNNQVGTLMQAERGHWGPGLPERAAGEPHLPGPLPMGPGQMLAGLGGCQLLGLGSGQMPGLGGGQLPGLGDGLVPGLGGGQPPCSPPLTPEMGRLCFCKS